MEIPLSFIADRPDKGCVATTHIVGALYLEYGDKTKKDRDLLDSWLDKAVEDGLLYVDDQQEYKVADGAWFKE